MIYRPLSMFRSVIDMVKKCSIPLCRFFGVGNVRALPKASKPHCISEASAPAQLASCICCATQSAWGQRAARAMPPRACKVQNLWGVGFRLPRIRLALLRHFCADNCIPTPTSATCNTFSVLDVHRLEARARPYPHSESCGRHQH